MPVVGHGFVAITAASAAAGLHCRLTRVSTLPRAALVLVLLSYLPDATATLYWPDHAVGRLIGHSLFTALAASLLMAVPIARVFRVRPIVSFGISLVAIVAHDLMDLLQSSDRVPFWPASAHVWQIGPWIPSGLPAELLLFVPGTALAIAWAWQRGALRVQGRKDVAALVVVAGIGVAAIATGAMRDGRERQLAAARLLAESGKYRAALDACADADRWPSTARPGRVDYIRALAVWGLGQRDQAEQLYRRSYQADPTYIWTVIDLGLLNASGDGPVDQRRRRAEPWLELLQTRFMDHEATARAVARIEQALAQP
jgi:membrane-bound metal-dependent hydrolase YbcI (DUF457 family)